MKYPDGSYSPLYDTEPVLHELYEAMQGSIYKTTTGLTYVLASSGWSRVWPVIQMGRTPRRLKVYLESPTFSTPTTPEVIFRAGHPMGEKIQEILMWVYRPTMWEFILAAD